MTLLVWYVLAHFQKNKPISLIFHLFTMVQKAHKYGIMTSQTEPIQVCIT